MRTTMTPAKIKVQHADPGDDGWTHTLDAEDENGASVALLLSGDVFQQLWAACERPEPVDGVWDKDVQRCPDEDYGQTWADVPKARMK